MGIAFSSNLYPYVVRARRSRAPAPVPANSFQKASDMILPGRATVSATRARLQSLGSKVARVKTVSNTFKAPRRVQKVQATGDSRTLPAHTDTSTRYRSALSTDSRDHRKEPRRPMKSQAQAASGFMPASQFTETRTVLNDKNSFKKARSANKAHPGLTQRSAAGDDQDCMIISPPRPKQAPKTKAIRMEPAEDSRKRAKKESRAKKPKRQSNTMLAWLAGPK